MHSTLYQNILSKALVTVPPKQYLLKLSVQCHIQRNVCNSSIWSKKFYQRALCRLYFTKINILEKFHFEQKSLQRQWLNCGRSQIHNWEITLVTEYKLNIPLFLSGRSLLLKDEVTESQGITWLTIHPEKARTWIENSNYETTFLCHFMSL